jgi:transposase InsO family protein
LRFSVPHTIITDNGSNFTSNEFQGYCKELMILVSYASVAHPWTNCHVEKANGLVCSGLTRRLQWPLERATGAWPEELPLVLSSLHTTLDMSTTFTPFFMVHCAEVVLPSEVRFNAPRVAAYNEDTSSTALKDDADVLDEAPYVALARNSIYEQGLRNYHKRRLWSISFSKGDLVPCLKHKGHVKLESPWERPIVISGNT